MLTAQLTKNDVLKAQQLHAKLSGAQIALLLLGISILGFYLYAHVGLPPGVLIAGVVGGLLGVAGYYEVFLRYRCSKIYRQQKGLRVPYEISWDSECICFKSEMGEGRMKWDNFIKFNQNARFILLYYSDALFSIVPKSVFTSQEQLIDFLGHLERIRN